jgi:hypothetical protein
VEAIDQANRLVTLKAADGWTLFVKAGPEVRNLAQVRVGDRVRSATEALLAEVVKPGRDRRCEHRHYTRRAGERPGRRSSTRSACR